MMQLLPSEPIGLPKLNVQKPQKGSTSRFPHFQIGASEGKPPPSGLKLAPMAEEAATVAA